MTTVDEALTVHPGKIRSGAFSRRSAPAYTRTLAPDTGAGRAATRGEPGRVATPVWACPAARARAPISSRPKPICALQHAYPVRARNPGPPAAICAREHVPGWAARTIAVAARGRPGDRGPRPGWAAAAVSDRGPGRPGDRGPGAGRTLAIYLRPPEARSQRSCKPDRPPNRPHQPTRTDRTRTATRAATRAAATARPTAATAHRKANDPPPTPSHNQRGRERGPLLARDPVCTDWLQTDVVGASFQMRSGHRRDLVGGPLRNDRVD